MFRLLMSNVFESCCVAAKARGPGNDVTTRGSMLRYPTSGTPDSTCAYPFKNVAVLTGGAARLISTDDFNLSQTYL